MNASSKSRGDIDVAIKKYNDHSSIKMSNENVSFESNLESTSGNILTKVRKDSADICNSVLQVIWSYEILEKKYFPKNVQLSDIIPVYRKEDPTLIENCRSVIVRPCVSKASEKII